MEKKNRIRKFIYRGKNLYTICLNSLLNHWLVLLRFLYIFIICQVLNWSDAEQKCLSFFILLLNKTTQWQNIFCKTFIIYILWKEWVLSLIRQNLNSVETINLVFPDVENRNLNLHIKKKNDLVDVNDQWQTMGLNMWCICIYLYMQVYV